MRRNLLDGAALAYIRYRAPILFIVLGAEGRILDANVYAKRHLGEDSCKGRFEDLVVDFQGCFDLQALLETSPAEHLLSIRMKSGLPQSFYMHFVASGEQVLVFGRFDTEEMKHMRKELLSMNQELSNLSRELHKKNAQLKRLNEEKNQFLGMAAHDLRKPIGVVMAYTEFLCDEAAHLLSPEQLGFLDTIGSSCAFMKRLVDDFLDASAIEAGKFDMDVREGSIHDVLAESLKLNRLQAAKKGVELEVQGEEPLPDVPMDASRVEQAVTNMVSNAIEHSPPGAKVTLALARDARDITFSVRDRGCGIPEEAREALFQPFEKAFISKTGREKSTGLGLAITRKIIEAHSGRIEIQSRERGGTEVSFSLPIQGAGLS